MSDEVGIFSGEFAKEAVPSGADSTPIMEAKTEALCKCLNQDRKKFAAAQEGWLNDLDEYAKTYKRLIYSKISHYVYTLVKNDETEYEIFESNLSTAYNYVTGQKVPDDPDERETFLRRRSYVTKFYDHVNLAHSQITVLYRSKKEVDQIVEERLKPALQETTDTFKAQMQADLNSTTETFETKISNTTKAFETKISDTTKEFKSQLDEMTTNLTSQLVSLVALFTALSFIVFGGISSLDSIFTVLSGKEHTVLPAIIVAIAWAFCMMNLLFLFVYFTLRIIAPKKDTEEKAAKDITFRALVQKYPLVFLFNYILLSLLLFTGGAYYAWITGIGRGIYDFVLSCKDLTFFIGLALILSVIVFSGRRLYKELRAETHK